MLSVNYCYLLLLLLLLLISVLLQIVISLSTTVSLDPDEVLTIDELVESRGFVLQKHYALTDDGYLLLVHRIVTRDYHPSTYNMRRKAVIAFHGVMSDSGGFFINSPSFNSNQTDFCGDNFGFCAVRTGRYDLWLPNARGKRFSREHIRYTVEDSRFWQFSLDEIAFYDLPAVVDLVRHKTGHRSVGYVGFSQGAAIMLELLSYRPEYGAVIRPFIAWAPAVFVNHAKTIIGPGLLAAGEILPKFPGEFLGAASFTSPLLQHAICRGPLGNAICGLMLKAMLGPSTRTNYPRLPVYLHHFPSSFSNWQVAHFGQLGKSGRFQRFDYLDKNRNDEAYGQPSPPEIPLWRIPKTLPIVVMHSTTDWLIDPVDSHILISTLRKNELQVIDHQVPAQVWSHSDYVIGRDVGRLVYDATIQYLDRYAWV